MRLLVATRSAHKLREIREILADVPALHLVGLQDLGLEPSPEEEGIECFETFEANALAKARYFHQHTGLPTVADDSGLEVDALEGAPGVRSKRFAPDTGLSGKARDLANNRYLVQRLAGVPEERRSARYVCVAALVGLGPEPIVVRGEAPGRIRDTPAGQGGFGYDPHFFDPELGKTFAELTPAEKHARSHRGRAFRALARVLREQEIDADPRPAAGAPEETARG